LLFRSAAVSAPPKLMDTTLTPGIDRARLTAASKLGLESSSAQTRIRLALGAKTWAHSTSRAISPAQPASVGGGRLVPPNWLMIVKLGGSGRPNAASNFARSLLAKFGSDVATNRGLLKAATIAIVCPLPSPAMPW
jgi:hypothetical protein